MSRTYEPTPVDTSSVSLTGKLEDLREALAANAHEVYARNRMAEGWRYGPARDDALKTNPTLVPYDALPEQEKEYDRAMVNETLGAMLALGYRIEPPLAHAASAKDEYIERARNHFRAGRQLDAFDEIRRARQIWKEDVSLIRSQAVYLNKVCAHEAAIALLKPLTDSKDDDPETWGNMASAHKSLGLRESRPDLRKKHFESARQIYEKGYRKSHRKDIWLGINAATMALLLGDRSKASELARETVPQCKKAAEESRNPEDQYWAYATCAEALLLQEEWEGAQSYYRLASEAVPQAFGLYEITRKNGFLILQHLGRDPGFIQEILPLPAIGVFCGHMIDRPGREQPRFPEALEGAVADAIGARIEELDIGHGYASAACGADILFLEALLENGAEIEVVLPCRLETFRQETVEYLPGSNWGERFDKVVGRARRVHIVSDEPLAPNDPTYQYMNTVLFGLARMHAHRLQTSLRPLAVWNGRPGDGPGGTADTVRLWRSELDVEPSLVDCGALAREQGLAASSESTLPPSKRTAGASPGTPADVQVMTLLFADVVGYSKMRESFIPGFVQRFMGGIAGILKASRAEHDITNTWGDALYCVFADPCQAGQTALELCRFAEDKAWVGSELPESLELKLRVSLHAGPVYRCYDWVLGRTTFTGTHVSRAARIEPITPANQVYVSEAYAALLAARGVTELHCDYVGETKLAKAYGVFPLYHLHKA